MKRSLLSIPLLCLFLASCSTVDIDDQTQGEIPIKQDKQSSITVNTHDHGAHYWFPERKMCGAIRKAPETIEGYHPIEVIKTYPSPYERPLGYYYDFGLNPQENLSNKLNSGRAYGRERYRYGPRHTWVYKKCMTGQQKALVDNFIAVMRACNAGNFGIYLEKIGGGVAVEGDNGRNCHPLAQELVKVHLQGYTPSLATSFTGFFGSGQSGSIVKAFGRCDDAGKDFEMNYLPENEKLTFSCKS